MQTNERGTVTLWILGLCICLLFLGGLSLDFWRAVATRRELSAMADAASTAGANGLDERALRAGHLQLDPTRAREIATATLARHSARFDRADVAIDGNRVVVELGDHVRFSLLGVFMGGERFDIQVRATSAPDERS
jgi:hypothetical protein